ncbi:MAG TPA: hypothetical protein VMN57_08015 [Anaerolineales bacterium]|nr:hypothetical protein [Anaerolineales bacterium]
MLTQRDFLHLPVLDPLIEQMTAEPSGLLIVAGLDPRPGAGTDGAAFLPSGRHGLFGIVMDEILTARPEWMDSIFAAISHCCGEEEPFDDRTLLLVEVG